ncbi:hypothetical protein AB0B52_28685 [Streptomyces griseofuscus]|uniref:hypothetical protein n=1 Tax=Streptomyces griseofuscus TaxID=146922 RepID=UPI0033E1AB07
MASHQGFPPHGFVTGSGRCGTTSLAAALDRAAVSRAGTRVRARHETHARELVRRLLAGDQEGAVALLHSIGPGIEVSPYLVFLDNRPLPGVPLVALCRDGRRTVASGMNDGWYYWTVRPREAHWSRLQPAFPGDRFEKCCRFWSWTYRRLLDWDAPIFRMEDILAPGPERNRLCEALGLSPLPDALPRKNHDRFGKAKFAVLTRRRATGPQDWTPTMRATFETHCGETMDLLYPGWRHTGWGGGA